MAGASLLIDYVLTVAVSVSSGVLALVSLYPACQPYAVLIGVSAIGVLMVMNLRGAKESGLAFAIPTYTFVVLILILVGKGMFDSWGKPHEVAKIATPEGGFAPITALLMLRAFAASCTALTGTEAIADGVKTFRPPEAKNAAQTLMMMVALLMMMFVGLSYIAMHEGIVPMHAGEHNYQTVVAQLAAEHFGRGAFFSALQLATALILFLSGKHCVR